ncbi:MAG TPA: OmpA family protein [Terriglobales bacterium]|nr:OmpA family protein [Terriglobales bacterium]
MKNLLAVLLLAAAAAYGQDPTPAQGSTSQQLQDQQQQAAPTQQTAAPEQAPAQQTAPAQSTPEPAAQQQTAPQQSAPQTEAQPTPQSVTAPDRAPRQQPIVAKTNLVAAFNGPTLSEVYCSGFITKHSIHPVGTAVAGSGAPEQAAYAGGEYIYLTGNEVQEGKEYLLLRHAQDPNKYQSFPGQLGMLAGMGELYQDLGRAKVLHVRKKVGVAQVESSCAEVLPGDIAVPFQERPRPEFKQTNFEQFAVPNGKTTGRIVMARDLDTLLGARRAVYLNIGEAQGVKPGDYFRITREYRTIAENPAESLPFAAPSYDPVQKNPARFDSRGQLSELPRRSVGELIVLSTTGNTATALTTYVPEDVHLGDRVEMIDATPFPPPAVAAAAAAQPPTIGCSVSRTTIQVGEAANITCNGTVEEGHDLSFSYQATAGQITPRDNRATLTGTTPGPVTVTATAIDDRNLSAQTAVNIDVQAPATPVTPGTSAGEPLQATPSMLSELTFKPNSGYVDNRSKAALDDVALRMQREPTATLILEGSANPSEGNQDLAAQRAENAKAYLTRSKGIDASRIQTRPAQSKTGAKVVVVLAPAGAPQ